MFVKIYNICYCFISLVGLVSAEKQLYPSGCHAIPSSSECCKYLDGRENTPWYNQPCVAVTDVTNPPHDANNPCQPLCFANNQCGSDFVGTISDSCQNMGKKSL